VLKCPGHFGTKYRCRSVLGPKCPGTEVSVKQINKRNQGVEDILSEGVVPRTPGNSGTVFMLNDESLLNDP